MRYNAWVTEENRASNVPPEQAVWEAPASPLSVVENPWFSGPPEAKTPPLDKA
jgi:hypothetical protein